MQQNDLEELGEMEDLFDGCPLGRRSHDGESGPSNASIDAFNAPEATIVVYGLFGLLEQLRLVNHRALCRGYMKGM